MSESELLERKDYVVCVTIHEARAIQGLDSEGTSDPFLKVKCADQVQQTSKKYEVNSAIWNQSLSFSGVKMNKYELETFEMVIELFDHNAILANEIIGQYSLGLSTLHRNTNHEFYKIWISLWNKNQPNKCMAYLLISAFIVGPNERPPMHSADEDFDPDDAEESDEDEDEIARKIENIKRAQEITPVINPLVIPRKYQLTVIIDRCDGLAACDTGRQPVRPFVSVRAAGCVLITGHKTKASATWFAKINIPIFYPILNDKITMRVWHKNDYLSPNTFLANIPEHPSQSDLFNISKLLAQDGTMGVKWINLYGTKPLERSSRTKSLKEGSQFLGRVLINIKLTPNDRPQLNSAQGNQIKQPKVQKYQIWVDLYELVGSDLLDSDDEAWIVFSIGQKQSQDQHLKWSKKKKRFKYKGAKGIQCEPMTEIELPTDVSQIPDIFLDLYTNTTFSDKQRIGYLRLPVTNCLSVKPKPNWFRLQSPYNDMQGLCPGVLLTNVQFLKYDPEELGPERIMKVKTDRVQYYFYYNILQAFELAYALPHDKLDTRVEVRIGKFAKDDVCQLTTSEQKGHYPIWNHFGDVRVELEREMIFEADMRVSVYNKKTRLFGGYKNILIGEFRVPVNSLLTFPNKPQFYNLLNEDGQFMGQILANFYLKEYFKDPKFRKIKNWVDPEHTKRQQQFRSYIEPRLTVDVDFSIFGIRNLIKKAVRPEIILRLTNQPVQDNEKEVDDEEKNQHKIMIDKEYIDQLKKDLDMDQTNNPNFGVIHTFKDVELVKEPLCWPYIQVEIYDLEKKEALIHSFRGCEYSFTTISLIHFVENLVKDKYIDAHDLEYTKAQISRNQDQLSLVQYQIDSDVFLKSKGILAPRNLDFNNLGQGGVGLDPDQNMPLGQMGDNVRQSVNQFGQVQNELQDQSQSKRLQGSINLFTDCRLGTVRKQRGTEDEPENLDLSQILTSSTKPGEGKDAQFDLGADQDNESGEDFDDLMAGIGSGGKQMSNLDTGIIMDAKHQFSINVQKRHKDREDKERKDRIDIVQQKINGLKKKLLKVDMKEKDAAMQKFKLRIAIVEECELQQDIKDEEMTEEKFWGAFAPDENAPVFDYGRDILKENVYEVSMKLPYTHFPLFTKQSWTLDPQATILQIDGILRSGNPSGALIKGQIRVRPSDEDEEDDDDEDQDNNNNKDKKGEFQASGTNQKPYEVATEVCNEISEKYPYDIFNLKLLKRMTQDQNTYRVRVYIVTAQNLSATGTVIDVKSKLAGMTAKSSANPYPVVMINNGDSDAKNTRLFFERDSYKENDLNPQFFQHFDLDARMPEDWKLTIKIMDRGMFMDQLIGQTVIDVENRLYANLYYMNDRVMQNEAKYIESILKNTKLLKSNKQLKDKMKKRKLALNQMKRKFKALEQFFVPVEFRELNNPAKNQAQGIIEMWVETLTLEDSPKIPVQTLTTVKKELYEIRLIIWETRDVPLVDGDNVDIFVKVTWDPTGRPEEMVTKRTDVHQNSKTGWGSFNWRMKFTLEVPCDFPRLKFAIHDEGVVDDESIGESTINLTRTVNKLIKEGSIDVPKTYITFRHPNYGDDDRGILMFSMTIIPKEDADAEPVGEAQEEPNENPFLKKPTAGRGIVALLSGVSFNLDLDFSWNPFGKFLYIILCIAYLGGLIYIAFMLK